MWPTHWESLPTLLPCSRSFLFQALPPLPECHLLAQTSVAGGVKLRAFLLVLFVFAMPGSPFVRSLLCLMDWGVLVA